MTDTHRFVRFCLTLLILVLALVSTQHTSAAGQAAPAPADIRAALEGTWQLEEWHVDGQVLRPPEADGRWSNHDGVALFMLHRRGGGKAESTMGYGVYQMDAKTWSYRYLRMENSTGPVGGPATVNVTQPPAEMRSFAISRSGGAVFLDGVGNDRRIYEGPFFTFTQKGQTIRKWRRIQ